MADTLSMPTARQRALNGLRAAFRAELSPEGASAYVKGLDDLPDAKLIAGIAKAIKECPTFPSVATLREHCRQAQPVVETVKLLPGRVDEDTDPSRWHRCWQCQDSGWLEVQMPSPLQKDLILPFAKRCPCATTNPAVLAMSGAGAR